jgi:hypothetical protein
MVSSKIFLMMEKVEADRGKHDVVLTSWDPSLESRLWEDCYAPDSSELESQREMMSGHADPGRRDRPRMEKWAQANSYATSMIEARLVEL